MLINIWAHLFSRCWNHFFVSSSFVHSLVVDSPSLLPCYHLHTCGFQSDWPLMTNEEVVHFLLVQNGFLKARNTAITHVLAGLIGAAVLYLCSSGSCSCHYLCYIRLRRTLGCQSVLQEISHKDKTFWTCHVALLGVLLHPVWFSTRWTAIKGEKKGLIFWWIPAV